MEMTEVWKFIKKIPTPLWKSRTAFPHFHKIDTSNKKQKLKNKGVHF